MNNDFDIIIINDVNKTVDHYKFKDLSVYKCKKIDETHEHRPMATGLIFVPKKEENNEH